MRAHRQTTGQRVTNGQLTDLVRNRIEAGKAVDALTMRNLGIACGSCRLSRVRREVQARLHRVAADAPKSVAAGPVRAVHETAGTMPRVIRQDARMECSTLMLVLALYRAIIVAMTHAKHRLYSVALRAQSFFKHLLAMPKRVE